MFVFRLISRFFSLLWFLSLIRGVLRVGRRGALIAVVASVLGVGGCGSVSHLIASARSAASAASNLTRTLETSASGSSGRYGRLSRSSGLALGSVTKRSGCRVGVLPDHACSPAAILPSVTTRDICHHGYTAQVRNVNYETKSLVYLAYGMTRHFDGSNGEVDHIVPLELGGANGVANLFPESAAGALGAHEKDQLEHHLNYLVCSGRLGLRAAQHAIASDWVAAFRRYVAR